jgi:hypothetical protein
MHSQIGLLRLGRCLAQVRKGIAESVSVLVRQFAVGFWEWTETRVEKEMRELAEGCG